MAFLLSGLGSLAGSLFSSPLVRGVVGDLAGGVVNTLKKTATGLLDSALGSVNQYGKQTRQVIQDYEPDLPRRQTYNKRIAPVEYIDEDVEEELPVKRRKMNVGRINKSRNRKPKNRVPYNPDLITEFEE